MQCTIPRGKTFDYCQFAPDAIEHFTAIVERHKINTFYKQTRKVAPTVADLNDADQIESPQIDEAA